MRYAAPTTRRAGRASAWSRLFTWSLNPMFRTATATRGAQHAEAVRGEVDRQRVGGPRRERRGVERELAALDRGEAGGIPERRLAAPFQRGAGLPHGDRLRADGKEQEQGAGVVGELLGR